MIRREFETWSFVGEGDAEVADEKENVASGGGELPLTLDGQGRQVLDFYWLDAYEEPHKHPGSFIYPSPF